MSSKEIVQNSVGISLQHKAKAIEEIETLLLNTKREGVEKVVDWMRQNNFYSVPASVNDHNSYTGGLLAHSLNVVTLALKTWESDIRKNKYTSSQVPQDSVVIASILHDICKCFTYVYVDGRWVRDDEQYLRGHGSRSVEIVVNEIGFPITEHEAIAIRYHDKTIDIDYGRDAESKAECDRRYKSELLLNVVYHADTVSHYDEYDAQQGGYYCPLHYIEDPATYIVNIGSPKPFAINRVADKVSGFSCVGLGDICLESVVRKDCAKGFSHKGKDTIVSQEIGGAMGNVMCNMAYMGWQAYPIALLDTTSTSAKIISDLERFGVDTRLVSSSNEGKTYIKQYSHYYDSCGNHEAVYGRIKIHSKKLDASGTPQMHISYKQVSSKGNAVANILSKIDFVPDVFFFDCVKPGHRMIAEAIRAKGALICFEPTKRHEKWEKTRECAAASDIVKVSRNDIFNIEDFVEDTSAKLVVQTLDSDGVRFNLFGQGWEYVPAVANDYRVDPTGAGDITTAMFLTKLAALDCLKVTKFTTDKVRQALSEAMVYAAYSISFLGSKAMWYADPECSIVACDND